MESMKPLVNAEWLEAGNGPVFECPLCFSLQRTEHRRRLDLAKCAMHLASAGAKNSNAKSDNILLQDEATFCIHLYTYLNTHHIIIQDLIADNNVIFNITLYHISLYYSTLAFVCLCHIQFCNIIKNLSILLDLTLYFMFLCIMLYLVTSILPILAQGCTYLWVQACDHGTCTWFLFFF